FWFYQLRLWKNEQLPQGQELVIEADNNFKKKIFVSNDLTLYLDNRKDSVWSFPLAEHLEKNGELLDSHALNVLHSYMSLHSKALFTEMEIHNYDIISFRQLLKMGYYINQIPLIMGLIQRWLYA
ncbi:hypothetical protein DRO61_11640, partial [Candidatus Bathyarchaeota archaeon]